MDIELKKAYELLKENDYEYIKKVLENHKNEINYDCVYCGWCIGSEYITDFLYYNENTYLNPKELESAIDEIIENEFKFKR